MSIMLIFLFLIGLVVGSFLNCAIYRWENNLPIFFDSVKADSSKNRQLARSFCPLCQKTLQWFELIPVLSFLIQKFRCRSCQQKISWQYPLVELLTAVVFSLTYFYSFSYLTNFDGFFLFQLIYLLIVESVLIVIAVIDYRSYIIPNKLIYPLILLGIFYLVLINFLSPLFSTEQLAGLSAFIWDGGLVNSLIATFSFSLFFFLLTVLSGGRWMGMGDAKLVLFMGLFLGWPKILLAIFLSFILGSLIALILIFSGQKSLKSIIPFGPFLILGTFISLLFNNFLVLGII